ncbi:TetR/AcrR family transcriptional regulator [Kineosporia mesophila]|uniref:TetR/AcrR family transcriptional regulator n=1 Tax=Kineosporia mesophila TaxID=566012 RepID=UPI001E54A246|nr:TetR/AcrR family transcriptional regulator [Kineosporia mesophila]MCD5350194.1 TetR/AcrR family transcriptional regulator [Kineosporia mesophila]
MAERAPVSRRERPAKPALSQGAIVDAALELLDAEGLDGVSMRRVAQKLDTGAASLYVYVRNREELIELLWDRVAGDIVLPAPDSGDWRQRLSQLALTSIETLSRHRDLASASPMITQSPLGPNSLRLSEAMLGLLAEGGLSRRTRVWAGDLIALYIASTASEEAVRATAKNPEQDDRTMQHFRALDPQMYPHLHDVAEEFTTLGEENREERRRWMVDTLISGVLAATGS